MSNILVDGSVWCVWWAVGGEGRQVLLVECKLGLKAEEMAADLRHSPSLGNVKRASKIEVSSCVLAAERM